MKTSSLVVLALAFVGCGISSSEDSSMYLTGTEQEPLMGTLADGGTGPTCTGHKVLICHIPPGNPANAHTICVGQPAVDPHQRLHGDGVGACGPSTADAGSPPPPPPPPAADAGVCTPENGTCVSNAQCCGTNECRLGMCLPPVQ